LAAIVVVNRTLKSKNERTEKMRIIRNKQLATLTFVPVDVNEEQVINSIVEILKPEDKMSYGGRDQDGNDDKFCVVYLHAGSHDEEKSVTRGNVTYIRTEYIGGVKLVLRGTTEEDKHEVNRIRDTCFFGSNGLIFIGVTEVDGKKAIVTIGKRCKLCKAGMIRYNDCEWSICDKCAARCEHNYVLGMVHGRGVVGGTGIGFFCDKCGRAKLKAKRKMTKIENTP